jgi:hypothetical protein
LANVPITRPLHAATGNRYTAQCESANAGATVSAAARSLRRRSINACTVDVEGSAKARAKWLERMRVLGREGR